ncbi:phBC6A51 family helix-turn-helix protein [Patescibacteria group bacterium]
MEKETNPTIQKRQEKNKELIVEQLKITPIVELASKKSGVSRASFYRWKIEDKNFAQEVEKALEEGSSRISDLAESKLISAIQDQNISAISLWLKSHHKDYGNKLEITGKIKTENEALTPEQEELIKQALNLSGLMSTKDNLHENDKRNNSKDN